MSVLTEGPYGRLAIVLKMVSSKNIEIIIIIVITVINIIIRCGSLIKLSNNRRTAERRRPLDEFNNGVVMTNRPLKDDELFEVKLLS